MSAEVSVGVSVMSRCLWCRCVWAGDECEGVCGVGVYGLGMSAEVSEMVVSVCMGWG